MEQEINRQQQLAEWIANPENITQNDAVILRDFALKYPYFQPVHLLLAKAALAAADDQQTDLATAALYTSGQLLHNILHTPDQLLNTEFHIAGGLTESVKENEPDAIDEAAIDEAAIDEVAAETDGALVTDEQEVFDEIGEINLHDFPSADHKPEPSNDLLEEDLVLENIVSADFFAFQDNFKVEDVPEEVPQIEEYSEQAAFEQEENVVSKYDDDRLPYTFLWWLAKTRKEHQQIFQPYASPKQNIAVQQVKSPDSSAPGALQHQYVENIFHMQGPFNEGDTGFVPSGVRRNSKGDQIIEKFIKNEPQISPPKPEQINNENKARKSAEDHNSLVSETLAKIYIEQMLYDKAIETYEKLSLMFPEKSRYFADLIQSIEKKI